MYARFEGRAKDGDRSSLPLKGGGRLAPLAGRAGWGSSPAPLKLQCDGFLHTVHVVPNVPIAEPDDANASRTQVACTARIALGPICVRVAVELDGKTEAGAIEVEDIRTNGMLPPKGSAQLTASQNVPKPLLDRRHALSERSGPRGHGNRPAKA